MRVLVFGDSITQGFWDLEGGWVSRLRRYYDERQVKDLVNNDEPTIFNLGISGDVTLGVLKRLDHETEARKWRWPDEQFAFIFAIGVNDSAIDDGVENSNVNRYHEELKAMIDKARKFSNRILFIGLTPCEEEVVNSRIGKDKSLTNKRILEFDETLKNVCTEYKVSYLSIFKPLKNRMDEGRHLFDDGLHPNNEGHQLIFELVRPELDRLLNT